MTPQQFVGLAVRLFAVWSTVLALQSFQIAASMRSYDETASLVPYIFIVVYLAIAICLWLFPMIVAHKLLPRTSHENKLNVQAIEAAAVGSVVVGLFAIVGAAPAISGYIGIAGMFVHGGQTLRDIPADQNIKLFTSLVQFLIGVALITKSRAVAQLALGKKDVS